MRMNGAVLDACVVGVSIVLLVVDGQARMLATMVIEGNIDALWGAGVVIALCWLISWLVFETFDYYSGTKDLSKND